ncbi:type II toxin-antitoxin system Phd/YefM family antitoxin [Treponema pectinovorum]|uniref:type II toxin-antitoxin system Phd/YefM family antitoxin n=1 Tax=Treponema pectinovorum TaxID=164 RepID=UPI0016592549|nr:prevent-host-death protein [Treponema pectinovorum]
MLEAKTNFPKLLSFLENGTEDEIIICKNNNPVAKIIKISKNDSSNRIGIAKDKIVFTDNFDDMDSEIAKEFLDSPLGI